MWASSEYRVLRGGDWNNNPGNARVSNRNNDTPDNRNNNNGFRLAFQLKGADGCRFIDPRTFLPQGRIVHLCHPAGRIRRPDGNFSPG